MRIPRKLTLALTFIALATWCSDALRSTPMPFTLTIEAEENSVKGGSDVKVDITLRNSSNRAMHISSGLTELDYTFEVRDSQNRIPPETEFARKSKVRAYFSNDQVFYLQPGESLPKAPLVITKFFDLSRPDKYTVQASRVVPKELGGGTIKSNIIAVTVTD